MDVQADSGWSNDWRSQVQLAKQAGSSMRSDPSGQGFTQLGLENFQVQSWYSLFGQPAPLATCPHRENIFLLFTLNPSCFDLCLLSLSVPQSPVRSVSPCAQ